MPCPEKFRESMEAFGLDPTLAARVNEGYETLVSSSPKAQKAQYFQRATEILRDALPPETFKALFAFNACCKSGSRQKAARAFAKANAGLPLAQKLEKIRDVPYMGRPEMNADGSITVHAVNFYKDGRYHCACSNFSGVHLEKPIAREYCYCCGGHFQYHYEIMLGARLHIRQVLSSPWDDNGQSPCAFVLEFIE